MDDITQSVAARNPSSAVVHQGSRIQSYGALLVFLDLRKAPVAYSCNIGTFFYGLPPRQKVNATQFSLSQLFCSDGISQLHQVLVQSESEARPTTLRVAPLRGVKDQLQCICHRRKQHIFFEFFEDEQESRADVYLKESNTPFEIFLYGLMNRTKIVQHGQSHTVDVLGELGGLFMEAIQKLTGFDRVSLFRFATDWTVDVIAEFSNAEPIEQLLGLKIPESLVPSRIRSLYQTMPFRYVADVSTKPIELIEEPQVAFADRRNTQDYGPLIDSSFCHMFGERQEYLQGLARLGVQSAASFTVVVNGHLWGVVSCHHGRSNPVSFDTLVRTNIVVQHLASAMATRLHGEFNQMRSQVSGVFRRLSSLLHRQTHIYEAIQQHGEYFMKLCRATGFAVSVNSVVAQVGRVPETQFFERFLPWVEEQMRDGYYHTDRLSAEFTEIKFGIDLAAGVLVVGQQLGAGADSVKLIWFRPETVRDIRRLTYSTNLSVEPNVYQKPSVWTEREIQKSARWEERDILTGKELHAALVQLMLSHYCKFESTVDDLKQKVKESEGFCRKILMNLGTSVVQLNSIAMEVAKTFDSIGGSAKLQPEVDHFAEEATSLCQWQQELSLSMDITTAPLAPQYLQLEDEIEHVMSASGWLHLIDIEYVSTPLMPMSASRDDLQLILFHLIRNAIQHHHLPKQCQILVSVEHVGDGWYVRLEDNGPGIDSQLMEELLMPFSAVCDGQTHDTGFGFPMVIRLMRRMKGNVFLEDSCLTSAVNRDSQTSQRLQFGVCVLLSFPDLGNTQALATHS